MLLIYLTSRFVALHNRFKLCRATDCVSAWHFKRYFRVLPLETFAI